MHLHLVFIFQENLWDPESRSTPLCIMVCNGLALVLSSDKIQGLVEYHVTG